MTNRKQNFGGIWTSEKLSLLEKYLKAYSKIMNKTSFRFSYIDAFAGTGYYKEISSNQYSLFMPEFGKEERIFLEGSAKIALDIDPHFHKYVFIEKDIVRCNELEKLKIEYKEKKIDIINEEANEFLLNICAKNWTKHRSVVFLDPYGMQVKWTTIEAIAKTKAIDLWLLFPLGIAVNRLLKKNGEIYECYKDRLTEIFGSDDWIDYFYKEYTEYNLFKEKTKKIKKIADFKIITSYFIERLDTIFEKVSKIPRSLYNSKNNPLFLLCFAAGNAKGAPTAVKIADDILRKF
jgi:three-Cys-motif partner protein